MRWIATIGRDVRQAWRTIVTMPAFAAVVIGSIGAGIGVNTVVFSWIQARVINPLPGVAGSSQFLGVEPRTEAGLHPGASWLEYGDLRTTLRSMPDLIAFRMAPFYLGEKGRVERVFGQLVSDNYFTSLGVRPALGRFFRPEEAARSSADQVAVISHGLWQARYGRAPDVLSRTVRVNGRELSIVGVAPKEFQGTVMGLDFSVWVPATLAPAVVLGSRELDDRGVRGYAILGKLRPSAARAEAQSELDVAMRQLAQAYPETNATMQADVLTFMESPRGPQRLLTSALLILQGVMLLLLLAVCGNMANLVLARASARQKEVGVRLALGAGPARIVSLLMTETVVLSLVGAAVGVGIAVWGTEALLVLPLTGFPIKFQTTVNALDLAFAVALGLGCGAIVGAAPAAHLSRLDPLTTFRAGAKSSGRSRMRNALMGVQVALALVVLVVAGLFLRSFLETRDTDPGFRREGVMLAAYDLAGRNAGAAFTRGFPERLLDALRRAPGVEAAAIATSVPLDIHGLPSRVFVLEGRAPTSADFDSALTNTVTPDYFAVLDIPILAGTTFAALADQTRPSQAVVNEAFVRRYVGESGGLGAALGRRLTARSRTTEIVGVVRDSLYNAFGEPPTPIIYWSYRDNPTPLGEIHVRTRAGAEAAIVPDIRRAVSTIDPELPVFNVRTLNDHIETNLVFRRVPARMFAILGPLLLVLVAIGIYAVVAYTVSLRTTEIGVRHALGATGPRLVADMVRQSLRVISLGALAGWLVAFAIDMVVTDESIDLGVFLGVPLLLLVVAAVACWLPARRATQMDPMAALRQT